MGTWSANFKKLESENTAVCIIIGIRWTSNEEIYLLFGNMPNSFLVFLMIAHLISSLKKPIHQYTQQSTLLSLYPEYLLPT